MNKITLFFLLGLIILTSCEKDEPIETFDPLFTIDMETEALSFPTEGGTHSFELESNENWSIGDVPDWILVKVEDNGPSTRSTTYADGKKIVTLTITPNTQHTGRVAEIVMTSASGTVARLTITQDKKPELRGYWILSEGYANSNNSELAWYDAATGELSTKQFAAINGMPLGDTGNDLQVYGSKMYCVVTGPGFGATSEEGTSYIEVIDPSNGKSIKRIPFTDAEGNPAKPRRIIFDGGKGYVSSYSNEVVRVDTATLAIDARASLTGTYAEGVALADGKIYVCNSGQGEDETISVVDVATMEETAVITTAKNPTGIVSTGEGVLYFNTNYPDYQLYRLSANDETITGVQGVSVADLTFFNNTMYSCNFSWTTYEGVVNEVNPNTGDVSKILLDMEARGVRMLMEYRIGGINGSEDIFISGMGQDVLIVNPVTKTIKHAFQTGVANGSGVVAYYQ